MWNDLTLITNVHGMRHLNRSSSRKRKWFYALVILLGTSSLLLVCYNTIRGFLSYDVNTVVRMSSDLDTIFPAVTICNMNMLREPTISKSLDAKAKLFLRYHKKKVHAYFDNKAGTGKTHVPNLTGSEIERMLYKYGHAMTEASQGGMLLKCLYHGQICSERNFTKVLTSLGLCHTFNSGVGNSTLLSTSQPGSQWGLKLFLSVQSEQYSVISDYGSTSGLKLFVHDQQEMPLADIYGVAISTGTHSFISLKKEKVESLEEPYQTSCRKKTLQNGRPYSRIGCLQLCQEEYIAKLCHCRLPNGFLEGNLPLCNMAEMELCGYPGKERFVRTKVSCECPEPCRYVSYSPSISYGYFPTERYARELAWSFVKAGEFNSTMDALKYARSNMVRIDVFFEKMNYLTVKQVPAQTYTSIYSDIGGILGISLGASFVTIIEMFDVIFLHLYEKFKEMTRRKEIQKEEQELV